MLITILFIIQLHLLAKCRSILCRIDGVKCRQTERTVTFITISVAIFVPQVSRPELCIHFALPVIPESVVRQVSGIFFIAPNVTSISKKGGIFLLYYQIKESTKSDSEYCHLIIIFLNLVQLNLSSLLFRNCVLFLKYNFTG